MKVQNISNRSYMHDNIILKAGDIGDVPQAVANIWLQTGDIEKYVDPVDMEKLKIENEKLKAQVHNLKTPKTITK